MTSARKHMTSKEQAAMTSPLSETSKSKKRRPKLANIKEFKLSNGTTRWRARAKTGTTELCETFDFLEEAEEWKLKIEQSKLKKRRSNHDTLVTTVSEILNWTDEQVSLREIPKSTRQNFSRLHRLIGHVQVAQLTQKIVNDFVRALEVSVVKQTGKQIAPDTFRRAYYAFKVVVEKWANHNDYELEFKFNHKLPGAWGTPKDRRISDEETQALKNAAASAIQSRRDIWPLLIDFLMCTGLRLQELHLAEFSDISKAGVLTVWADSTKTKKDRHVQLTEDALEVVAALPHSQKKLFDFPSTQSIEKQFKILRREASLMDVTLHDFRHEYTSRLVERTNLSHAQIMALTGHKSLRTYQKYYNLRPDQIAPDLAKIRLTSKAQQSNS